MMLYFEDLYVFYSFQLLILGQSLLINLAFSALGRSWSFTIRCWYGTCYIITLDLIARAFCSQNTSMTTTKIQSVISNGNITNCAAWLISMHVYDGHQCWICMGRLHNFVIIYNKCYTIFSNNFHTWHELCRVGCLFEGLFIRSQRLVKYKNFVVLFMLWLMKSIYPFYVLTMTDGTRYHMKLSLFYGNLADFT